MTGRPTTLWPVAVALAVFGMLWGSWAVASADIERALRVGHGGYGVVLSIGLAGAAAANAVVGGWTERWGTERALTATLLVWAVVVGLAGAMRPAPLLAVLVMVVVTAGAAMDVVMNIAATAALQHRPGSLVRLHSLFNAGALVGAAAMGVVVGGDRSWRWVWGSVAVLGLALAVAVRGRRLPAGGAGESVPLGDAVRRLREGRLWLVAATFAVGAMVEGGIDLWGVLYLRTQLHAGLLVGAGSAVAGYAIATAARSLLGPAVGRRGTTRGVALGGGVTAVGLFVLVAAPGAVVAACGFAAAAGGVSMCWPLLLAHAGAGVDRPGPVIGAVTAVGYVGFVVGPVVVGGLASVTGLRVGLGFLAASAVFVAAAPQFA